MKRIATFVLAAVVLAAAAAGAETYRFTLEQAIAYGLQNSTSIKSKALAMEAARQDLVAARSGYYPSLSASASWSHLFERPFQEFPGFGRIYLSGTDPLSLSANLSQTVYTFGKLKAGVQLAAEGVAQASLDLAEETRKTVVLIKKAYYAYLLTNAVLDINEQTLGRKQDALEVAQKRYAAGLVADYEVLRAESDLESYRATVISSRNAVHIALLNVRNALGIQEEEFSFELLGSLEPLQVKLERKALLDLALARKYELLSFRKGMDVVVAQERLNRSLNKPTLAGFVGYQLQSGFDAATGGDEYFTPDAWEGSLTAGLSLSVPVSALLPWSKESAAIRKSELQLENLKEQYLSLESSIRIAVESGLLNVAEQEAKIASGKKSVELAQRLYESAEQQYLGGYISSVDLKDAQLGLNGAQLANAQAIFGYNQNILELMDLVGVAEF
jgi:outer membrane protein TolC